VMSVYLTDRGVDNNDDPDENDGKIYEIDLGQPAPPTSTATTAPSPSATATVPPSPSATAGPSATATAGPSPTATPGPCSTGNNPLACQPAPTPLPNRYYLPSLQR
jgi:hypothetical protein